MQDRDVFYVYPQKGRDRNGNIIPDKTTKIAAKFLFVDGKPVVDPNPHGSSQVHIYRGLNADGRIDEASVSGNPNNYLIVPADYTPAEAINFATGVDMGMAGAAALGGPSRPIRGATGRVAQRYGRKQEFVR